MSGLVKSGQDRSSQFGSNKGGLLDPKTFLDPKTVLDPNFFQTQNLLDQNFFGLNTFMNPKSFLIQNALEIGV